MQAEEADGGAAAPETIPGVGESLRRARRQRGLTLEQVATELRIEAPQLLALEEERFEAIGPPVFVKGYLRHYCALLELDYPRLLALYERAGAPQEVALRPSRTIKLRNERQVTLWVVAVLALAAIVAVLFLWWRGDLFAMLESPRAAPPPASVSPS